MATIDAQDLRKRIRHFQVLIMGRANTGKTTILQKVCNTTDQPEIYDTKGKKIDAAIVNSSIKRGNHDITNEMVFKSNPIFIFHDSCGFEAGCEEEFENMKKFISERAHATKLEERIHAICSVVAIFTKFEALRPFAYGEIKKELKGVLSEERSKRIAQRVEELFTKTCVLDQLCNPENRARPKSYTTNCDTLLESTTLALDDEELRLCLVSMQQSNLELCIKCAITILMDRAHQLFGILRFDYEAYQYQIARWFPHLKWYSSTHAHDPYPWLLLACSQDRFYVPNNDNLFANIEQEDIIHILQPLEAATMIVLEYSTFLLKNLECVKSAVDCYLKSPMAVAVEKGAKEICCQGYDREELEKKILEFILENRLSKDLTEKNVQVGQRIMNLQQKILVVIIQNMPQKNKKARQAKTQRAPGSKFFSKNYIDSVKDLDDADYIDEENSYSDLDDEGWIMSLPEHEMTDLSAVSDSEGEKQGHGHVVKGNLDHIDRGIKRQAVGDGQSSCEVSDEEGVEEFEAYQILTAAEEFWQKLFTKHINRLDVAPLKGKGSYTGTSRSSFYRNQSKLCQAAVGTAKLSNFFQCSISVPYTAQPTTIEVDQSNSTSFEPDTPADADDHQSINPPEPPAQFQDMAPELLSDMTTSNNNTEAMPKAASFLDPTADDELDPPHIPIGKVIKGLIKDTTKYKSFSAQFKLHAIRNYLELFERYRQIPNIKNPAIQASLAIAKSVGKGPYLACMIRRLVVYIHRFKTLPPSRAGKHHAHPSLLNNERVYQAVRRFLTIQEAGKITPHKLQHEVNKTIIPALGLDLGKNTISKNCVRHWLKKLGYELTSVKKGVYVNGHERADIVEYRKAFLAQVAENEHLRNEYDDTTLEVIEPNLLPGERKHVPVHHDESIFRSNELQQRIAEENALPVNECLKCYDSHKINFPGKNADGWWTAEMLVQQVEQVIPLFERTHPGAVAKFFFDQSAAHGAFAVDALNASEMNVKPGGKQRHMHSTLIPTDNPNLALCGVAQDMCFAEDLPSDHQFYEFCGQPKGLQALADSTFPTARRLVPELLNACPTKVIWAFYRKMWCYMDAYRKGLNAKQAEYAVKKYRSHRKVGAGIMMDMAILNNPE
ncbi:uncharacterized protein F5147DRAFT_657455 [Suillus discolor]|uniref:G domain-containing protein n=1 Tax=Suillus discolor TaxID=1912936 RepID=A0A9P7JNP2_9AGAM|nr:uncharacterized protein F5147DRAFT_657455 [Suillus discolor]KAG2093316.1 hypothetical protein F5147DRAFT_657455 [Suillus discolor]